MSLTITCATCSKEFTMSDEEVAYFKKKGYQMRKHCLECSAKRRETLHQIYRGLCATCGCDISLPFNPSEGGKYYCRQHYTKVSNQH